MGCCNRAVLTGVFGTLAILLVVGGLVFQFIDLTNPEMDEAARQGLQTIQSGICYGALGGGVLSGAVAIGAGYDSNHIWKTFFLPSVLLLLIASLGFLSVSVVGSNVMSQAAIFLGLTICSVFFLGFTINNGKKMNAIKEKEAHGPEDGFVEYTEQDQRTSNATQPVTAVGASKSQPETIEVNDADRRAPAPDRLSAATGFKDFGSSESSDLKKKELERKNEERIKIDACRNRIFSRDDAEEDLEQAAGTKTQPAKEDTFITIAKGHMNGGTKGKIVGKHADGKGVMVEYVSGKNRITTRVGEQYIPEKRRKSALAAADEIEKRKKANSENPGHRRLANRLKKMMSL